MRGFWLAMILPFLALSAGAASLDNRPRGPEHRELIFSTTDDFSTTVFLWSENGEYSFLTDAELRLSLQEDRLSLELRYPLGPSYVGLPYNVFSIEVSLNGHRLFYEDFTDGGVNVPLDLFPNVVLPFPVVQLERPWQSYCSFGCELLVRVEGYL